MVPLTHHSQCAGDPCRLESDLAQPGDHQGGAVDQPGGRPQLGPEPGGLVLGQFRAALEAVEDAEGGELGERQGVDTGGGGDLELLQRRGVQPRGLDGTAGPGRHGVDPLEAGVAAGDPGQARGALIREPVQDLGLVEHVPVALLLLRGPAEGGVAGSGLQESVPAAGVRVVEDGNGRIYGADAFHKLGFERDGDRDGGFSRHGVHHTE